MTLFFRYGFVYLGLTLASALCVTERKSAFFEDEETDLFIEVDCFNVEPVLGPAPEGLSQQQLVRRCILGSILESEKNYLDALKRILEQYEKPLLEVEPRLLSDRKLKMIFYRVREILQCHFLFQIALASRVADWDNLEMIGDVFVASFSKSMVLDAYSEYVNNFSTAMAVVRKTCAAKPSFLDFLKLRQETSGDRVTLYGLMMKPIQRFPQFILLLQDMLKNTPVGHGDRLPLQMALTELETLAEKLNEKKREADQRCEIRHIAKAMNERYLNKVHTCTHAETHTGTPDWSPRCGWLSLLIDPSPLTRCSQDGSGGGAIGNAPPGHKFLLKWSVPLGLVDVVEFGSSEDVPATGRHPGAQHHSGEKVVINAKPSKLYMGPGQLYQDLQNLIHDLSLVNQISSMIGSLKGIYQNVNPAVAQDWMSGLQRLILKKEEEIRAADRCRIQLQLPGKHDKLVLPLPPPSIHTDPQTDRHRHTDTQTHSHLITPTAPFLLLLVFFVRASFVWEQPSVLNLGVLPIKAMLAVEEHVWVSCGGHVFIVSTRTQLEAHQEEGMVVSHMVVAGVGIWIAFSSGSTLRLFHTETLEHLQDINIATPVHNLLAGTQRVTVSSLLVCYGLLLVGTNLGMTVALSVPRLQGIPKVTGRGMVSFHAHHGPVRFLTMAAAVCNRTSGDQPAAPAPGLAPTPGETSEESPEAGATPIGQQQQQQRRGGGVWLGEAGCTAMALQDSLSSSSCGSLAPSQGSLEHGPEDGALYDLLHDPAQQQHQRGRGPASKVDVSSLLVVSGGLGHRRVNRKSKAPRHEDSASTVMVWQIPLLNM
uniref:Rho guanine nucleotide exchange factor 10 n=1 Tax=Gadus morhua TaxID=8049 RepID=A0A8C5B8W9_GADMO